MQPETVVIVLTTWPAGVDPGPFASALVELRLAACVNVLPDMESTYRWQGRLEHGRERQVIVKTTVRRVEALRRRLAELHPYEVPELLVLEVKDGTQEYITWVRDSTGDST